MSSQPPFCPQGFVYTVQAGDTMFVIAQRFGVSLDVLIAANPQIPNPNLIFPGERICVPIGPPPPPPAMRPFVEHLRQNIGRTITAATTCGTLTGQLTAVFFDHYLMLVNNQPHHVRIEETCWVVTPAGNT